MRYSLSLLLGLIVAAPSFANDSARAEIANVIKAAKIATDKNQHETAEKLFATAALAAQTGKFPDLETEANIGRANNLKSWAAKPGVDSADRQFACNNLGVLYLRLNNPKDAVAAFDLVKEPKGADAYAYLANHARAMDKARRPKDALRLYQRSLAAEPRFAVAAERAAALLVDKDADLSTADRRKAAVELLGSKNLPAPTLRATTGTLLSAWKDEEAAEDVLPFLVRYLADSKATADWFSKNETARFAEWETSARLKDRLVQLRGVYESLDFPAGPDLLHANLATTLPAWSKSLPETALRKDFARLVAAAGDDFASRARAEKDAAKRKVLAEQAVRRYSFVVALSQDDTQARLAAVGVVLEHRSQLDPMWKLLNKYAEELFGFKSEIYQKGQQGRLTEAEYRTLGALHITLATILEAQKHWSESMYSTLSVEFQLKQAIWVEGKLRQLGKGADYPVSPGLRTRLAEAQIEANNKSAAVANFRDAADLYLTLGNAAQAETVLKRYHDLQAKNKLPSFTDEPAFAQLENLAKGAARKPVKELAITDVPRAVAYLGDDLIGYGAGAKLVGWKVKTNEVDQGAPWSGTLIAAAPKAGVFICDTGLDASKPGRTDLWSAKNGAIRQERELTKHDGRVRALAVSPDGQVFASVGGIKDGLKVYNIKGEMILVTAEPFDDQRGIALLSSSEVVVTGKGGVAVLGVDGANKGKTIWKAATSAPAVAVAASADGKLVAAGLTGGKVTVRDGKDGTSIAEFEAHSGAVRALAFAPGRELLATLGPDQAVRVWDARTGKEVARYGHPRAPTAMSFSPDGNRLVITSDDFTGGLIRVWELPTK